jgi:hypothetical protein
LNGLRYRKSEQLCYLHHTNRSKQIKFYKRKIKKLDSSGRQLYLVTVVDLCSWQCCLFSSHKLSVRGDFRLDSTADQLVLLVLLSYSSCARDHCLLCCEEVRHTRLRLRIKVIIVQVERAAWLCYDQRLTASLWICQYDLCPVQEEAWSLHVLRVTFQAASPPLVGQPIAGDLDFA